VVSNNLSERSFCINSVRVQKIKDLPSEFVSPGVCKDADGNLHTIGDETTVDLRVVHTVVLLGTQVRRRVGGHGTGDFLDEFERMTGSRTNHGKQGIRTVDCPRDDAHLNIIGTRVVVTSDDVRTSRVSVTLSSVPIDTSTFGADHVGKEFELVIKVVVFYIDAFLVREEVDVDLLQIFRVGCITKCVDLLISHSDDGDLVSASGLLHGELWFDVDLDQRSLRGSRSREFQQHDIVRACSEIVLGMNESGGTEDSVVRSFEIARGPPVSGTNHFQGIEDFDLFSHTRPLLARISADISVLEFGTVEINEK
jgi:hypothetical protein